MQNYSQNIFTSRAAMNNVVSQTMPVHYQNVDTYDRRPTPYYYDHYQNDVGRRAYPPAPVDDQGKNFYTTKKIKKNFTR